MKSQQLRKMARLKILSSKRSRKPHQLLRSPTRQKSIKLLRKLKDSPLRTTHPQSSKKARKLNLSKRKNNLKLLRVKPRHHQ